ncbi:MAG: hypothetical protein Q4C04_04270 [Clostridia bacterium]|nr:hypothetical protein [Clostridia bacterium]
MKKNTNAKGASTKSRRDIPFSPEQVPTIKYLIDDRTFEVRSVFKEKTDRAHTFGQMLFEMMKSDEQCKERRI